MQIVGKKVNSLHMKWPLTVRRQSREETDFERKNKITQTLYVNAISINSFDTPHTDRTVYGISMLILWVRKSARARSNDNSLDFQHCCYYCCCCYCCFVLPNEKNNQNFQLVTIAFTVIRRNWPTHAENVKLCLMWLYCCSV